MKPHSTLAASQPQPGSELFWTVWSIVAAFGTYFCMYAYRKPFTAAEFGEDLKLKTILVTTQVLGYMVSKFIGIKVIAEMRPERRAGGILTLIGIAQAALVVFGIIPPPWNAVCLFINGLALGMVFGLVLGFLEGRQQTEALAAGLCASFILADGVTKSLGTWLLNQGVSEFWMPAAAGAIFALPLGVFVWMLSRIPPPSAADVAARTARPPIDRRDRWSLLHRYAWGLSMLVVIYLAITVLRSVRADFAPQIWEGLSGERAAPAIFTYSEIFVALGVMVVNGSAVFIRDNRRAFFASLGTCGLGFAMLAAALFGWQLRQLGGFAFMVLIGLGLYLPYVAFHTTIFERLLAMTRDRGNVGFLMYVVDSIGYLGYVAVMLLRMTLQVKGDFVSFFVGTSWVTGGVSLLCLALCWRYFAVRCPGVAVVPVAEAAT